MFAASISWYTDRGDTVMRSAVVVEVLRLEGARNGRHLVGRIGDRS